MNMGPRQRTASRGKAATQARSEAQASRAGAPAPPPAVAAVDEPQWLADVRTTYAVHNVVGIRSELPFWLIRWDGKRGLEWMDLGDPKDKPKPFHFEIYFGKETLRDEHYLEAIDQARRTK